MCGSWSLLEAFKARTLPKHHHNVRLSSWSRRHSTHPKKVQGVHDAKLPRDKKALRSFLGSISFLRKFIPDLATIVAPLTHLTRKGVTYRLNQSHIDAFDHVKSLLSEHVLLNAPRGDGAFVLVCDASDNGLGAALLQWQDGEMAILEFASKTLTQAEMNWPAYEREAFAIRWSVQRFEDYIKSGHTIVVSDHKPLLQQWISALILRCYVGHYICNSLISPFVISVVTLMSSLTGCPDLAMLIHMMTTLLYPFLFLPLMNHLHLRPFVLFIHPYLSSHQSFKSLMLA